MHPRFGFPFPPRHFLFLCLAGGCAVLAGCGSQSSTIHAASPHAALEDRLADGTVEMPPDSPKLRDIRVELVKSAEVPLDEVVSPGRIEVNPNRVSKVMLPLAGRVSSVRVRLGDSVERGQTVLTLESPDADAAQSTYLQAQAGLTQAQANLNKAQSDCDRADDLYKHGAVASKEVLTAQNALEQAKAGVVQAKAALEQAARRLGILGLKTGEFGQQVVVAAPISGKVLDLSVSPGEYRSDPNAPLATIADLSTVWVASDVPENVIRFIQIGERIDVTLGAYPGETFHARATRIADMVDPLTRTIKVRAELDNSRGRLRPEMYGIFRHTETTRVLPVVPFGAVVQEGGKSMVWVEEAPGCFRPVQVKTGDRIDSMLPLLSGIKAGQRVVVDGAMLLRSQ
jgi:membrane fusion protein, heavy metal efflux system